jgi:heme-degrading monooxygenase HmoA
MYISRSETTIAAGHQDEAMTEVTRVHEFMRTMPGFRWAMLLKALDAPDRVAAVSMWTSPEQASEQEGAVLAAAGETRGYDVTTARGAMTPATHVAIVEWQVADEVAGRFTNRWNAAYHAIEDRIGSRLLRDLGSPGTYAGLHAVKAEAGLNPEYMGAPLTDGEGLSVRPVAVLRYEVVQLTEA